MGWTLRNSALEGDYLGWISPFVSSAMNSMKPKSPGQRRACPAREARLR
jgi:hypothetical protein